MSLGDNILIDEAMIGSGLVYNRPGRVSEAYRAWLEAAVLEKERAEDQAWAQWDGIQREPTSTGAGVYLIPPGSDYQHAPPGTFPPGQCCPPDPMALPYTDVTSDSLDTTPVRERIATGDWFTGDLALAEAEAMTGDLSPADERVMESDLFRAFAGLGTYYGALGAFDQAAFDSGLSSAQSQSARGNRTAAEAAMAYAAKQLAQLPPNDPRFSPQVGRYQAQYANVQRNLARTPEEVARYNEGVAASDAAQSRYRNESDVRRDVTGDLEEAASRSVDQVKSAVTGAAGAVKDLVDNYAGAALLAVVGVGAAVAFAHGRGMRRNPPRGRRSKRRR